MILKFLAGPGVTLMMVLIFRGSLPGTQGSSSYSRRVLADLCEEIVQLLEVVPLQLPWLTVAHRVEQLFCAGMGANTVGRFAAVPGTSSASLNPGHSYACSRACADRREGAAIWHLIFYHQGANTTIEDGEADNIVRAPMQDPAWYKRKINVRPGCSVSVCILRGVLLGGVLACDFSVRCAFLGFPLALLGGALILLRVDIL